MVEAPTAHHQERDIEVERSRRRYRWLQCRLCPLPSHTRCTLASRDRARALKLLLAREFEGIEALVAGIEEGGDGRGTVLLSGRNDKAISVLREQLDGGKRRLAIFYGAAHLPDLEERLWALGFRKVKERWLVAWDMRRRG